MFHRDADTCLLTKNGDINPVYFFPTRCIYPWLQFYIQSYCHTDPGTAVRCETPVIIGNTFLLDLIGTTGLLFTSRNSCSEAMGNLIIDLVDSSYNM